MQVNNQPVPMYGRRQTRHWSRTQGCMVFSFVGILLMLCSCIASLALYIVIPPKSLDILVMGLDSRGNEGAVTRTDSIVVVGINPSQLDVSLLSIPRDIFINVPNYGLQRINTINVLAEAEATGTGPTLLAASIETSFGIGIDKYIRLDFQAFTALVDSIGGITIDVPFPVVDNAFPTADYCTTTVRFEQGRQHMDGETALIYARTRHQDDDYQRALRQQLVIGAISRNLINPVYWIPAWVAIQANTETNLNPIDIAFLAPPILFSAGDLNQLVINREYILPGDGYVIPNYNALAPYIQENFD